jgi:hypothetical protein
MRSVLSPRKIIPRYAPSNVLSAVVSFAKRPRGSITLPRLRPWSLRASAGLFPAALAGATPREVVIPAEANSAAAEAEAKGKRRAEDAAAAAAPVMAAAGKKERA